MTTKSRKLKFIAIATIISLSVIMCREDASKITTASTNTVECGKEPITDIKMNTTSPNLKGENEKAIVTVTTKEGCGEILHVRFKEINGIAKPSWSYVYPKNTGNGIFEARFHENLKNKRGKWEIVEIYLYNESTNIEYLYEINKEKNVFKYKSTLNENETDTTIKLTSSITVASSAVSIKKSAL
ncbi:MAG: hypothetical protein OEZ22_03180 [Spirochaetia bacterium]|nr:hypothetical protein [Spirochaetia bacterium]